MSAFNAYRTKWREECQRTICVRSVTQKTDRDERNDGCRRNMTASRRSCASRACYMGARMLPDRRDRLTKTTSRRWSRLNDPVTHPETHDLEEEELESSRSLWIELGKPIWNDALREFPLHGVPDAVALPGTGEGVLIKFQDAGELIEAVLAVDECLRFVANKAAEKARLPFTLPLSAFVAPRIQIMPDGHSRIAQDLLHDAILPALAVEISRRSPPTSMDRMFAGSKSVRCVTDYLLRSATIRRHVPASARTPTDSDVSEIETSRGNTKNITEKTG